jgi:hypothetical protein
MRPSAPFLPIAVGLLLFFSACKVRLPHATQAELGASLLVTLQKNDTLALQQLIATKADIEEAIGITATMEETDRAALKREAEDLFKDFDQIAKVAFLEIQARAKEEGVDLRKAKFLTATAENCRTADTEICDILIHFTAAGKTWEVFIDDAGKATSGWILGFEGMNWMGEVTE